MLFRRSKYKIATRLGMIGSAICAICGLIALIVLSNMDNFKSYYNYILYSNDSTFSTLTMTFGLGSLGDFLETYGIDLNEFGKTMYIITIFSNIVTIVQVVPCFIFAFLTRNDNNLKTFAFQKRTALHVLFIVFLAVTYLNGTSALNDAPETASYYKVSEVISILLGTPTAIVLIVAFFMALSDVRMNKRIVDKLKMANYHSDEDVEEASKKIRPQENNQEDDRYGFDNNEFSFDNSDKGKEVKVEERDFPEVKQEEVKVDNEKLDEVYSLLAKLEKQYKAGEVSEEDYNRMKKTILDNYLNK